MTKGAESENEIAIRKWASDTKAIEIDRIQKALDRVCVIDGQFWVPTKGPRFVVEDFYNPSGNNKPGTTHVRINVHPDANMLCEEDHHDLFAPLNLDGAKAQAQLIIEAHKHRGADEEDGSRVVYDGAVGKIEMFELRYFSSRALDVKKHMAQTIDELLRMVGKQGGIFFALTADELRAWAGVKDAYPAGCEVKDFRKINMDKAGAALKDLRSATSEGKYTWFDEIWSRYESRLRTIFGQEQPASTQDADLSGGACESRI
jgi:hypothetical protein